MRIKEKKRKTKLIIIILATIALLVAGVASAFFSDKIQNVLSASSGTLTISVHDMEIEENNVYGSFVSQVTNGDVNTFHYTISNTGSSEAKVETIMHIAWKGGLDEAGIIYLYPATMSDTDIRNDIINNNATSAIIKHTDNDQNTYTYLTTITENGFEKSLGTDVISAGDNVFKEYKVALDASKKAEETAIYFNNFEGKAFQIEIECRAEQNIPFSNWIDTQKADIALKDAHIDMPNTLSNKVELDLAPDPNTKEFYNWDTYDNYVWYGGYLWQIVRNKCR